MFKRMSALIRRAGDSRAQFSEGWRNHAAFISDLPGVRGYLQNHVVESFPDEQLSPLRADGFVELRFDSPAAMAEAFRAPAAALMAADEPNFLGHGSGYALAGDDDLRPAEEGQKLIVALISPSTVAVETMSKILADSRPVSLVVDLVTDLIAKPGMSPPRPVHAFYHGHYYDVVAAQSAVGRIMAMSHIAGLSIGVFRVRTVTIV